MFRNFRSAIKSRSGEALGCSLLKHTKVLSPFQLPDQALDEFPASSSSSSSRNKSSSEADCNTRS